MTEKEKQDENERRIQILQEKRRLATIELNEIVKERKKAMSAVNKINNQAKQKAAQVRSYSAEIGMIKTGEKKGKVTDHAIVRYLERYKNFDVEAIANEILEHPDAKFNEMGLVSTVYRQDEPMSKDVADVLKLAKMKGVIS